MPLRLRGSGGGGGGLKLRTPADVFVGATKTAAETARNSGLDSAALAEFNADPNLAIILRIAGSDTYQVRRSGAWRGVTNVVEGPRGPAPTESQLDAAAERNVISSIVQVSPGSLNKDDPPSHIRVTLITRPNAYSSASQIRVTVDAQVVSESYDHNVIQHVVEVRLSEVTRASIAAEPEGGHITVQVELRDSSHRTIHSAPDFDILVVESGDNSAEASLRASGDDLQSITVGTIASLNAALAAQAVADTALELVFSADVVKDSETYRHGDIVYVAPHSDAIERRFHVIPESVLAAERVIRDGGDQMVTREVNSSSTLAAAIAAHDITNSSSLFVITEGFTTSTRTYAAGSRWYLARHHDSEAEFTLISEPGGDGVGPDTVARAAAATAQATAAQARQAAAENKTRIDAAEIAAWLDVNPRTVLSSDRVSRIYTATLINVREDLLFTKHQGPTTEINRLQVFERASGAVLHDIPWAYSSDEWVFQFEINAAEATLIGDLGSAEEFEIQVRFGRGSGNSFVASEFTNWTRVLLGLRDEFPVTEDRLGEALAQINQLPEFPAAGSRNGKIAKFDEDDLTWQEDTGDGSATGLTKVQQIGLLVFVPEPGVITYGDADSLSMGLRTIKLQVLNPELLTGDVWVEGWTQGQRGLNRTKWSSSVELSITITEGWADSAAAALISDRKNEAQVRLRFFDASTAGNEIERIGINLPLVLVLEPPTVVQVANAGPMNIAADGSTTVLTARITPRALSTKIRVDAHVDVEMTSGNAGNTNYDLRKTMKLFRGSVELSQSQAGSNHVARNDTVINNMDSSLVDSPNSIAEQVYTLRVETTASRAAVARNLRLILSEVL